MNTIALRRRASFECGNYQGVSSICITDDFIDQSRRVQVQETAEGGGAVTGTAGFLQRVKEKRAGEIVIAFRRGEQSFESEVHRRAWGVRVRTSLI